MIGYQLSPEQLSLYRSQGFLLVRLNEHNLVNPADLQGWVGEVRSWPQEKGKWMPYNEINARGESQLMRTECFVDYHKMLKQLLCGESLLSVTSQLSGRVRCLGSVSYLVRGHMDGHFESVDVADPQLDPSQLKRSIGNAPFQR